MCRALQDLHLQKYSLSIEEVEEQPTNKHIASANHKVAPLGWQFRGKATKKEFIRMAEGDNLLRHVYRYGVNSHNLQRKAPSLPSANIDDVVEECEHGKAVGAHNKYKRA